MSDVSTRSRALVEAMQVIDDPTERLGWIVSKGRRAPALEPRYKADVFKIEGCISELWLVPSVEEGRVYYRTDAAAAIPKGVAAVLAEVYSGGTPEEILAVGDGFIRESGLPQVLTPNRSNGLSQLVKRMLAHAAAAKAEAASTGAN